MVRLLDLGVGVEYAVRALALLAKRGPGAVVTAKELAEEGEISIHFLYNVFSALERHNLVQAHKGRRRGFSLARPANQISFLDILYALEGAIEKRQCLLDRRDLCREETPCAAHSAWQYLREQAEKKLSSITLDRIAKQNPPWERLKEASFLL